MINENIPPEAVSLVRAVAALLLLCARPLTVDQALAVVDEMLEKTELVTP